MMLSNDRKTFNTSAYSTPKQFNKLIKEPKKRVKMDGEMNFSSDTLLNSVLKKNISPSQAHLPNTTITPTTKKRGRPKKITDSRYKVCRPKMISPALESKLETLKDYVEEFQVETGRITFEKYIDTLAEAYIKTKLGVAKEEHLREEIEEAFDKLNNE
ncbi:hypothetical protein P0E52_13140 [Enterococcus faecalis]|uniref:hypothetical protein n=1 Tax=Enterococcus faecalis TaxID=1351 RepID=UPI001B9B33BE|nr:hypothetical protein [Enterococcus faecalis]MDN3114939.1 hypothetical protein [Enterococcus faecalis]HBC4465769.1 hypothetical protein [Enterococcus faecalis]